MNRLFFFLWLSLLSVCSLNAQSVDVLFSHKGGFYDQPFALTLTCSNPTTQVRYTVNGEPPTAESRIYQQPLQMSEQIYSTSNIYKIHIVAPDREQYIPDKVKKCITIRAAAFDAQGNCVSPIVTNSYFIKALGGDFQSLPVMSICTDSLSLFDNDTGIFVPGVNWQPELSESTGNYMIHGEEWERIINVEYYNVNNEGVNQVCGLRTHGYNARTGHQKGLTLYAREAYGKKRFSFPFFVNSDIDKYKRLVLKPFECGWHSGGVQDCLGSWIAQGLNVDALNARPVVLFINGEYWGIYYLEEKTDERYLESHYGVDPDECTIINSWYGLVENGDNVEFNEMMEWLADADLSEEANFQQMSSWIDIDNFIDYQLYEIFIANQDWPGNNMRCWKTEGRKWRWLFYDADAAFYKLSFDGFANALDTNDTQWPTGAQNTLMLRKLLENETFQSQFIKRYYELAETVLQYRNMYYYLNRIVATVQDQVGDQVARFQNPTSFDKWQSSLEHINSFLRKRELTIKFEITDYLHLEASDVQEVVCYPNPCVEDLNINFQIKKSGIMPIQIVDVQGHTYYSKEFYFEEGENQMKITTKLPTGIFLVKVGDVTQKVIILR